MSVFWNLEHISLDCDGIDIKLHPLTNEQLNCRENENKMSKFSLCLLELRAHLIPLIVMALISNNTLSITNTIIVYDDK